MNTKDNPTQNTETKDVNLNETDNAGHNSQSSQAGHPEDQSEQEKELSAEEKLQAEIDSLKEQLSAANDKYVRTVAEFENYRKRSAKDRLELISTAGKEIIEGLLPTLDDCERALKVLKESDAPQSAVEGTELIYSKLEGYLRSKGVAKIEAAGKPFDTDYHEAVAQMPATDKKQKNMVIDTVQQGYTLNGKVIRFAKVVVAM